MKRLAFVFITYVCSLVAFNSVAFASSIDLKQNQSGIQMSPFLENINLDPSKSSISFNINYSNSTNKIQELDLTTEDFGSLNNTGGILLEGSNPYTEKYGLTAWMSLSSNTVTLNPNSSASVQVTIKNESSLSPGGHYGAVIAKVNNFNNSSNGNIVTINQQLVNLVLIDKTGGDHFNLKLTDIKNNGNWLVLPSSVVLTFQNPGNVQVVPRGLVRLLSPTGKTLAQGIINPQSSFILPESYQDFIVNLNAVSKDYAYPGIYSLSVDFRYDGLSSYYNQKLEIKYVDFQGFILLLILVWLLFFAYKKVTKFKTKNRLKKN